MSAQKTEKAKPAAAGSAQDVVTLASPSPLYEVRVMVRAGSADDPKGKEGAANLVARALIEGGFGDPKNPVTKEKLADITRPWGERAMPSVLVEKQTTTFSVTVPKDAFPQFMAQVLRPMFQQPLFRQAELDRLRKEALVEIQSRLRFEEQEMLGLQALDNFIFAGTPLDHLASGTVKGLAAVTRDDLAAFYKKHYRRGNIYIGASVPESEVGTLVSALPAAGAGAETPTISVVPVQGRQVLIITQPNAIATGIHFGFPIQVTRADADYWPLFVGNVALGTHRDDFGRLYHEIRAERGYNYGDYSYIEYLFGRPYFLFPPPTTPRTQQYFSIWVRPVGQQYAHFILKAATAELDRLVRAGLTPGQLAAAKVKARTLYLNYAESAGRQLGYRLDDLFYGMQRHGYLQDMLKKIDAVTPEQVNAAIRKHLQSDNLKYVIVTNESEAAKLADDIANNRNVRAKTLEEYHISQPIPPEKQQMLDQDQQWVAYPLNIPRENIHIVKAEQMFETTEAPGLTGR